MTRLCSIEKESYEYQDGFLKNAWCEKCSLPKFVEAGNRYEYVFERDEEGYLSGYREKKFCGEGEVDRITDYYERRGMEADREEYENLKNYIQLIQEKKRKDTGISAERWRRPNYKHLSGSE